MDSFRNNFSELFAAFSSDDSKTILVAFLGTLLIGWLMRYFWDRWKLKSLEEDLLKKEQEKTHFKTQWEQLQNKYALQEADLKKANLELVEKTTSLDSAEGEKRALNSRLNTALVDLDKSKEEFQEASNRMEDLNDQILGLRTKNAQLSTEMDGSTSGQYAISQEQTALSAKYEKEVADLAAENSLLKSSIQELKDNIGAEGTTQAALRVTELEVENEALKSQLSSTDSSQLGVAAGTSSASDTAALEAKIDELEAEKGKLEDYVAEITQLEDGNEALNNSMQSLISENDALQSSADALIQYEAGNEVLNATIVDLIEKNQALEEQLAETTNNQVEWAVESGDETEEEEELDVEDAKNKFRAAIGDQIAIASSTDRDDLKQINGVGPFIEEKLNDLGIYTFEQISQLDENMVNTLTTAIEFFPGRIERDDWVGQADRLFYTKGSMPQDMNSPSKIMTSRYANATEKIEAKPIERSADADSPTLNATSRSASSVKPDDLKKIEGIGPKISEILNNAGIYTFSNLSLTPVDRLKNILAEAGNRYKIHDPTTWPEQAQLAAAGEWERLKALQDDLDGGRFVAKG